MEEFSNKPQRLKITNSYS